VLYKVKKGIIGGTEYMILSGKGWIIWVENNEPIIFKFGKNPVGQTCPDENRLVEQIRKRLFEVVEELMDALGQADPQDLESI
jgi:hypothetical protein